MDGSPESQTVFSWNSVLSPPPLWLRKIALVTAQELDIPSTGYRKNIKCLSFWFKFPFILSVNLEEYSHFIKLIQIESK